MRLWVGRKRVVDEMSGDHTYCCRDGRPDELVFTVSCHSLGMLLVVGGAARGGSSAAAVAVLVGVAVGASLGIIASVAAGRALGHVVESGSVSNALPLFLGMLMLGMAALIASVIPARRATRIEPLEALRYE